MPTHSLILSSSSASRNPFFHDACVYLPTDELYLTSNPLQSISSSQLPIILISKLQFQRESDHITAVEWQKLRPPPNMAMPAGATAYRNGIIFCSQGTLSPGSGGLFYMPTGKPPVPMVTSFGDRPFNSPHKVTLARDGSIWFTDCAYGFEAEIRARPRLPNQVYRFEPATGSLRVVADGHAWPSGIAFSPDEETLYVSDADASRSDGSMDPTKAATIYAYGIISRAGQPFLVNRRVFAFAMKGVPKDVQCDAVGNVYAACGDGVEVWNAGGFLLGIVEVHGGCSILCFGRDGEMFIGADENLWRIQLDIPRGDTSVTG